MKKIILILMLFLLSGCTQPKDNVSPVIEERYEFDIYEIFSDEKVGLAIDARTKIEFNTGGYDIQNDISIDDKMITLTFEKIRSPKKGSMTTQAFSPAGLLEEIQIDEGEYLLELAGKNSIDAYLLKITKEEIILVPKKATFTETNMRVIKRFPKNGLSATCYAYENNKPSKGNCEYFFNEISKIASRMTINDSQDFPRTQIYTYEGDDQRLLEIVKTANDKKTRASIKDGKGNWYAEDGTMKNLLGWNTYSKKTPNLKDEYIKLKI